MTRSHRRGLTLVELLVVIFIIGVLVALLLPAIQAAREAARRAQCKNHLRQLALAAMMHEEQIGWFPTGGWSEDWVGDKDRGFGREQPGGWAYNILPFVEAEALHDLPADGMAGPITPEQLEGAKRLIESPIEIIYCPSRREPLTYPVEGGPIENAAPTDVAGKLDYAANSGTAGCVGIDWRSCFGFDWGGVSFPGSEVAIRHVTDGTSKTYLIGEKWVPNESDDAGFPGDQRTWISGFSLWGNGNRAASPPRRDDTTEGLITFLGPFGSAHRSGFHMAYCDGSVHVVSYDIDRPVHQAASDRYDGAALRN